MEAHQTKMQKFMIEPSESESLMRQSNLSSPADLLPILAGAARLLARPPISNFRVGAAALGSTGRIYLGVNVEFPGLPLHHSIHAEQFLVANASLHGETKILSVAVSAAPCGHCRQFLQELRDASRIRILVTSDPEPAYRPLSDFLPRPFGPLDVLSDSSAPFLLEKNGGDESGGVTIEVNSNGSIPGGGCNGVGDGDGVGGMEGALVGAATEAARGAHAPYSGCPSGFAVADGEGRVYRGSYMESAAYNPSLGPVQAAMVGYVVGGGEGWDGIVGGALAEGDGGPVSQEGTARVFFEKVAPSAEIWVSKFKLPEPGE